MELHGPGWDKDKPFDLDEGRDMRTIIVGDIHGHVDSVDKALAFDGNVVFVGDYLDSFGQSVDNQITCLIKVLEAVEQEPERVVGLIGNHEMSYLEPDMRCSGWNPKTQAHVDHMKDRMRSTLREYWWVGDYLVTHGGVDQMLLHARDETVDEYLERGDYKQIGNARGGYAVAGGLYWNDFNREMLPPPALKQVVGHTNWTRPGDVKGVRVKYGEEGAEVWCVDNLCREMEVLLIEDNEARPYNLDAGEEVDDDQRSA